MKCFPKSTDLLRLMEHLLIDRAAESMVKIAGIWGLAGGAMRGAYGLAKGTAKNVVGAAFSGTKGKPLGNKIFTWGSRIGLGAGAYGTGKYVYNRLPGAPAQPNYTTAMRNNVLAGKRSPEEMSQQDLTDVRTLGMRKMAILGAVFTALGVGMYADDALKKTKTTMGKSKLGMGTPTPKFNVEGGMRT